MLTDVYEEGLVILEVPKMMTGKGKLPLFTNNFILFPPVVRLPFPCCTTEVRLKFRIQSHVKVTLPSVD
jgi:hypothetical protein